MNQKLDHIKLNKFSLEPKKLFTYAMFFFNILHDRQTYDELLNMAKEQDFYNKINSHNYDSYQRNEYNMIGYIIVEAMLVNESAKFLYANKNLSDILSISQDQIKNYNSSMIMPENLQANHYKFIRKFYADGETHILGKNRI